MYDKPKHQNLPDKLKCKHLQKKLTKLLLNNPKNIFFETNKKFKKKKNQRI